MSQITDKLMRGAYLGKRECADHAEEIERCLEAYPRAMAAMEQHERQMQSCKCDWDMDITDEGRQISYRIPVRGCVVHAIEDADHWADIDFPYEAES